jgi:hypothetical protein
MRTANLMVQQPTPYPKPVGNWFACFDDASGPVVIGDRARGDSQARYRDLDHKRDSHDCQVVARSAE